MNIIKAARGRITGHFGDQNVPGSNVPRHLGMDLGHGDMTPADLAVVAPAAGTVTAVGTYGTYGLRVIISHGGGYTSLLAHLSRSTVTVGQVLDQGDPVGVMGSSGGAWPVHLHQELRRNGIHLDPALYLSAPSGVGSTTIISTTDNQEDPEVEPFIITLSAAAAKYLYLPARKSKRSISALEWSVMRKGQAAGATLRVVTVTAAELAAIPGK